jgi:hypothetical protein
MSWLFGEQSLSAAAMADSLTEALKLLGFATPFAYAAAAFGFFHYLDNKVSDEGRAAISSWLQPKEYDKAAVAHAIVEIFDRVYTRPLLGWRAILRSASITFVVVLIFLYEIGWLWKLISKLHQADADGRFAVQMATAMALATNVTSDYLSLFVVRRWLFIGSTQPFLGLAMGPLVGMCIIYPLFCLRDVGVQWFIMEEKNFYDILGWHHLVLIGIFYPKSGFWSQLLFAALAVHLWLALLAFCVVLLKAFNWLRLGVGGAQWFFKDGKDHPLDAIGYVAATVVFAGASALRLAGVIG